MKHYKKLGCHVVFLPRHIVRTLSLALLVLGSIGENQARAGIVISGDPNADQRARDNGFNYSVEGGGSVGWLRLDSELGVFNSSLVFINSYTAIASAHQFDSRFGVSPIYTIGTDADFKAGATLTPTQVFLHPDYAGSAGQGVDLAVIRFDVPVANVNTVTFANGRPNHNETIWFAGYGIHGNRIDGYLGQDGFIRAGTSRARSTPPLLGGDPALYQNALFDDSSDNPTGLRGAPGDSGGGVFTIDGQLTGIIIGGNTDISGSTSMFLNLSAPTVSSFINSHITAVPEPNSLVMLSCVTALSILFRRGIRTIQQCSTSA